MFFCQAALASKPPRAKFGLKTPSKSCLTGSKSRLTPCCAVRTTTNCEIDSFYEIFLLAICRPLHNLLVGKYPPTLHQYPRISQAPCAFPPIGIRYDAVARWSCVCALVPLGQWLLAHAAIAVGIPLAGGGDPPPPAVSDGIWGSPLTNRGWTCAEQIHDWANRRGSAARSSRKWRLPDLPGNNGFGDTTW